MGLRSTFRTAATGMLAAALVASGALATGILTRQDARDNSYAACRGTDPDCYNDWREDDGETRVLVYSRTVGPRHAHLGTALGPGLNPELGANNVAQQGMVNWGEEYGFDVDWTEDHTWMNSAGRLRPYDAVIFLSSTRDTLDDNAQTALMQYVRSGGGFVGIHNAFGTEYHWEWYEGLLGGTNFYDHGRHQEGTVTVNARRDVTTTHLPSRFTFKDEWYNLYPYPSEVRVLLSVDESSWEIPKTSGHPGHGREHPVSWCQYYDGGRAFLTTLGHDVALWTEAPLVGGAEIKEHIVQGVLSAAGEQPFCR
ncbi:ThuA domain-containing protein [Georgenia sunbinii]|uniref:ThuA domain-containing protein n=1 Tax=Georgenia sunbinii TaxID=3117728 RepID=UPI002F25F2EB